MNVIHELVRTRIRVLVTLALVLPYVLAAAVRAQDTQALFLGNSYTGSNDLPGLVTGLALAGGHAFTTDRNTPGGNTLGAPQSSGWPHKSHPTSLAKIASSEWDLVVLQEQSFLPTLPAAKTQYMFTGAASLVSSIQANHPATRTVLFQTWGRRDGGTLCALGECFTFADFDAMQDALTAAYSECAALVGAEVAPVGEAWRLAFQRDPALVLHATDGSHPNLAGSYLAACVFFATIFDESPIGLGFTGGLTGPEAAFLQAIAAEVTLCGFQSYCSGAPNSAHATGASIAYSGSSSVAANDLQLSVHRVVPGSLGLFFYGSERTSSPLGDGFLCVRGTVVRLPPPLLAGAGNPSVTRVLDLGAPPLNAGAGWVTAGSTWNFQYWYRDPGGPGGSGFNLSDALAVTFCP